MADHEGQPSLPRGFCRQLTRAVHGWVSTYWRAGESKRRGIHTRTPCLPSRRLSTKGNRGQGEASSVCFLPKMTVDKVNRIRIAKILAGDLSLDRGSADDRVLAVTMLKHSGPLLRSNLISIRLSSTRSTVGACLAKSGHCVSSKLSCSCPWDARAKCFPCRL